MQKNWEAKTCVGTAAASFDVEIHSGTVVGEGRRLEGVFNTQTQFRGTGGWGGGGTQREEREERGRDHRRQHANKSGRDGVTVE